MSEKTYEGWVSVFSSGTDYEADLVRDRLDDADVPAVVLTQRDHAFNLNVGDLAAVRVMVPPEHAEEAVRLLEEAPLTDEELERAAMEADADAPDAHDVRTEAALDSGIESIDFSVPDEPATDEEDGAGRSA